MASQKASLDARPPHNQETGDEMSTEAIPESGTLDVEKQANSNAPDKETWITGFKLFIVVTSVTLIMFLMLLDISILSTATPKITTAFHSLQSVGWYGAAYQLSSATLQPLTGKMYSNFNTKWTFFAFLLLFELGSLLCGASTSSNMLIVGRAVAGMGGSGLANGGLTIIAGAVPMAKRPALMGIMMGFGQLALVGGPLIGGLFTQYATWRWCFYVNLPIGGAAAALLVFLNIPEHVEKPNPVTVLQDLHNKLDLVGFVIFAPAIIMLLLAVQYGGNDYPWNSPVVIGLFCGGGVMFLIWLVWDHYRKDEAMIPLPMLRKRHVWTSCLVMGIRGRSAAISGVFLLPGIVSQLVAAIVSGKLVGVFGYYLPWCVSSGVLMSVGYGLLSTLAPYTSAGNWIGYQILAGTGRGFGLQMPLVAVQNVLTPKQIPLAISLVMFSQNIGGALFLSFADTVFTNSLRTLLAHEAPGVDVASVVAAGAYSIRLAVPQEALSAVLKVYSWSIDRVFYMCAGLAGVCFLLSWGMGWFDIRKKRA